MRPGAVCEWIVLRRGRDRRVSRLDGRYYTDGRPVPAHLVAAFDQALTAGHLRPVDEGHDGRRLVLTLRGRARFDELTSDAPRMPGPAGPDE